MKARAPSCVLARHAPWYFGGCIGSHTGDTSTSRRTFAGCAAANDAVVVVPQDQPTRSSDFVPPRLRM